jgi:hypothetical protein
MLLQPFPLSNARPSSAEALADTAHAALDAAVALARTGNRQQAREICAAVIFEAQPMIAAHADLLRATVYVLLLAHAFGLLARLVGATSGRNVTVTLLPQCNGPIAPPHRRDELGRTNYMLDSRWLDRLSPDDMLLRHLCDALIARRYGQPGRPDATSASRHLEPA